MRHTAIAAVAVLALAMGACDDEPRWQLVQNQLPGALLSVWGTIATDVWAVGADARDGTGPQVIHFDGSRWQRYLTGESAGDLWWVFGFDNGPVYMGGAGGLILRYQGGAFTRMSTPGTDTVFGIWGASPSDVWAVGGTSSGTDGFAWRLQGDSWVAEPSLTPAISATGALWKAFGRGSSDVWLVGANGVSLYWDGSTLTPGDTGVGSSLFTVHASAERFVAVGGLASGIIVENGGSGWVDATPDPLPSGLSGVCLDGDSGYAVGLYGGVYRRASEGWQPEDLGFFFDSNLHAVWIDPEGGVWAAGGQTLAFPLTDGVLLHKGDPVPEGLDQDAPWWGPIGKGVQQ